MNESLELATDKLSEWQARLGEILTKPERQLINNFVSKAHSGEDPGTILTHELKTAIRKAKSDKKAAKLLKESLQSFSLADEYDRKNSLYPKQSLNTFRRKAYSMLGGGE